jgi:hypothetical protein
MNEFVGYQAVHEAAMRLYSSPVGHDLPLERVEALGEALLDFTNPSRSVIAASDKGTLCEDGQTSCGAPGWTKPGPPSRSLPRLSPGTSPVRQPVRIRNSSARAAAPERVRKSRRKAGSSQAVRQRCCTFDRALLTAALKTMAYGRFWPAGYRAKIFCMPVLRNPLAQDRIFRLKQHLCRTAWAAPGRVSPDDG